MYAQGGLWAGDGQWGYGGREWASLDASIPVPVAGVSAGVSTAAAALAASVPVAGVSDGVATAAATLAASVPVAGVSAGVSSVWGVMAPNREVIYYTTVTEEGADYHAIRSGGRVAVSAARSGERGYRARPVRQ